MAAPLDGWIISCQNSIKNISKCMSCRDMSQRLPVGDVVSWPRYLGHETLVWLKEHTPSIGVSLKQPIHVSAIGERIVIFDVERDGLPLRIVFEFHNASINVYAEIHFKLIRIRNHRCHAIMTFVHIRLKVVPPRTLDVASFVTKKVDDVSVVNCRNHVESCVLDHFEHVSRNDVAIGHVVHRIVDAVVRSQIEYNDCGPVPSLQFGRQHKFQFTSMLFPIRHKELAQK